MASLAEVYFKKETLEQMLRVLNAKGQSGLPVTIAIKDEVNKFNQNVTMYPSQSKEDREAKKERYYIANGKVFWTDGKVTKVENTQQAKELEKKTEILKRFDDGCDDLPF